MNAMKDTYVQIDTIWAQITMILNKNWHDFMLHGVLFCRRHQPTGMVF
jgi:hypothetical protein